MANEDARRNRAREHANVKATADQGRARATGARKPGVVARAMERCRETVESIRLPRPDWRTFFWGLLILIGIILIVRNWAPVRINLFGWYLDAPKAVVFAIFFGLGMVTSWLIEVRNRRAKPAEDAEPEAEVAHETEEVVDAPEVDAVLVDDERDADTQVSDAVPEPEDEQQEEPLNAPEDASSASEAGDEAAADREAVLPTHESVADSAPPDGEADTVAAEIAFDEPVDPDAMRSLDVELDADIVLGDEGAEDGAEVSPDDEDEAGPFRRL